MVPVGFTIFSANDHNGHYSMSENVHNAVV